MACSLINRVVLGSLVPDDDVKLCGGLPVTFPSLIPLLLLLFLSNVEEKGKKRKMAWE